MRDAEEHEPPQYRAARLHRVLAEDARTAELGVQVTVRGEDVYLTGTVSSPGRRDELDKVLRELEPEAKLHNDVRVVESGEPGEPEVLR
ncbi:hypothetical protein FHU38_002162 [Saccharomonospora amisosensis]|uniref:BON domain-containing protein n=1 Tax=Saccharomonospora amisosensis TaxID=1128677 RepID=A0A7X5UQD5_9PSEU|nr:BON domain-containing protein [Saccharomonospora amisosensis]NIJ11818.1 hypothetical protein [Saccharomonospora amisosensis]